MTDHFVRPSALAASDGATSADRIGRQSVRSGVLVLGSSAFELAIRLGTLIVLSRLLTPEDFGLFAIAMVPVMLLFPLGRMGFPMAVTQRTTLRQEQVSRLFWIGLKFNALLVCAASLLAALPAIYFDQPEIIWLTLLGASGSFFAATTSIHLGILRRRMRFDVIAVERCVSAVCGAATALALALANAGAWALMLQQTTIFLIAAVTRWIGSRWRPESPSNSANPADPAVREFLHFGRHVVYATVLEHIVRELPPIIVGGIANIRVVGLYQNAQRWASLPVMEMIGPVSTIAVSGMSRLRDTAEGFRRYARAVMVGVCSTIIPFLSFLIIDARSIIQLVLGPQWLDATPFLRLIAAAMCAECLMRAATWSLYAEGRMEPLVRWALGHAIACAGAMCLGAVWGAIGVASGFAIIVWVYVLPTYFVTVACTPLTWTDLRRAVTRPLLASAVASAVVMLVTQSGEDGRIVLLTILRFLVFAGAYAAVWLAIPGALRELRSVYRIARDRHSSTGLSTPSAVTENHLHEHVHR